MSIIALINENVFISENQPEAGCCFHWILHNASGQIEYAPGVCISAGVCVCCFLMVPGSFQISTQCCIYNDSLVCSELCRFLHPCMVRNSPALLLSLLAILSKRALEPACQYSSFSFTSLDNPAGNLASPSKLLGNADQQVTQRAPQRVGDTP